MNKFDGVNFNLTNDTGLVTVSTSTDTAENTFNFRIERYNNHSWLVEAQTLPNGMIGQKEIPDNLEVVYLQRKSTHLLASFHLEHNGSYVLSNDDYMVIIKVKDLGICQGGLYDHQREALAIFRALVNDKLYLPLNFIGSNDLIGLYHDDNYLVKAQQNNPLMYKDAPENRGIFTLPTGAGKTRIFLTGIIDAQRDINVVGAPSIALTRQLELEFKNLAKATGVYNDYSYAVVSSDKAITEEERKDVTILKYLELVPKRTVNDIETFLNGTKKKIIFVTYQSARKIKEALINYGREADIFIADEAHRVQDSRIVEILTDFPVKKLVFFTATKKDRISNTEENHDFGMYRTDLYGEVLYDKSPMEMVTAKIILPFVVLMPDVKHASMIEKIIGQELYDRKIEEKYEFILFIVGLIDVWRKAGFVKAIVYGRSIKHMNMYIQNFDLIRKVLTAVMGDQAHDMSEHLVTGKILGGDRAKVFDAYNKCQNGVLFNYAVIREGIDVSDCNTIAWLRKMDSINIVQTAGRCLRLDTARGKQSGYVIAPLPRDAKQAGTKYVVRRMAEIVTSLARTGYRDTMVYFGEGFMNRGDFDKEVESEVDHTPEELNLSVAQIRAMLESGAIVVDERPIEEIVEVVSTLYKNGTTGGW
jgi:superfamily II DNA or RNA helicase